MTDQCKFLHDRGDYKSGWQLEREWDAEQARKKKKLEDSIKRFNEENNMMDSNDIHTLQDGDNKNNNIDQEEEEEDDENKYVIQDENEPNNLPFACFICRESFTNPIVTLCKHYFCQECAINYNSKNAGRCAACGKPTTGVFNVAHKLIKYLNENKSNSNNNSIVRNDNIATGGQQGQWEDVET